MITYRTVLEIAQPDTYSRIIEPELYKWLDDRKGHDLDSLGPRWSTAAGSRASLVEHRSARTSERFRRVILEEETGYRTAITTRESGPGDVRLWIDIESPQGGAPAKVPALVRALLSQVDCNYESILLTETPRLVTLDDVDRFVEEVLSSARRTPMFVAGSARELPFESWRSFVAQVTRDTAGMSSVAVLDPEATEDVEQRLGPRGLAVPAGTIRTFLPINDLEHSSDARRHKILGTDRLIGDSVGYLRSVLASVSRRTVLKQPLAKPERDAERLLSRLEISELLGLEPDVNTGETPVVNTLEPATVIDDEREAERPTFGRRASDQGPQLDPSVVALGNVLVNAVMRSVITSYRDRWGRGELSLDAVPLIQRALSIDPDASQAAREQVRARVEELEVMSAGVQDDLREQQKRLEDLDLELALVEDDKIAKDRIIRDLQKKLSVANLGEQAYSEPVEADLERPTSFAGLVDACGQFEHVNFTCDWDQVASLDETVHAPTSRVLGVWEGLLALNDYARSKIEGEFSGSLHEYLKSPPAGYAAIPLDRYAATESQTVRTSRKLAQERMFKVPKHIAKSGFAEMSSHLKKGVETTDPRVHFLDATGKHSVVVVGYIGPHLTVKSTN